MSQPLLRITDLKVHFPIRRGVFRRPTGAVKAVDGVSFAIQAGETFALVGESGCGKSTTGYATLGMVRPTSGQVDFQGVDLVRLDRAALREAQREMQIIFQDPYSSLDPKMTVGESIGEPLLVRGVLQGAPLARRVAELLVLVGLQPQHATRYPHEFSGGQRQRIVIARALALSPKLIVCDEPVSALDVSIRSQILNLLMRLQRELGVSYLFISHDMAIVERVSHRVAVMYLGQIVEIGPRRAVFGDPQHPYTRKLMSAVPVADPSRRRRKRELSSEEIPSPIRRVGDNPRVEPLREVAPGHYVAAHPVGGAY